ncbi:MAG: lipase family protein [Gammaproteobacteria bacterium]
MATSFDREFARLLLEICRYTYAKSFRLFDEAGDALKWIDSQTGKTGKYAPESLEPIRGGNTSVACVFRYPDKNIVCYMGTKTEFNTLKNGKESIEDWLKNFRGAPVSFKFGKACLATEQDMDLGGDVHAGFLSELTAVQAQVVDTLLSNGGKAQPLYVTGHSQGGAEATLATRALLAGGFNVEATYTFAAPRAGDQVFANSIPADFAFHRIEFGDDIVPHVPPTLLSKWAKNVVAGLLRLPLPRKTKEFLQFASDDFGYVGVGRLCYGDHENGTFHVDMNTSQEVKMFLGRLTRLAFHPEHWAEHHHLAGTSEEVEAGKEGNYTALVSNFPLDNE